MGSPARSRRRLRGAEGALAAASLALSGACSSTVDVAVKLVDPCNQSAVATVDYLKFEPRGVGIDSFGLSTTVDVASGSAPAIQIPLSSDFQLVVSGYRGDPSSEPVALGVSAARDLSVATDAVDIRVPFALLDAFYKTTDLTTEPGASQCSKLNMSRYGASATYLPANGKVLVLGGASLANQVLSYSRLVELYDPDTGQFIPVGELRTGMSRAFHTATLLADGRVLITGGEAVVSGAPDTIRSALIVDARDPNNVTVDTTDSMEVARIGHTAVRLADGRVVVAGGRAKNPASGRPADQTYHSLVEVYDPSTGTFSVATNAGGQRAELSASRFGHSGTLLQTGFDVMVAGGMNGTGPARTIDVIRVSGNAVTVVTSQATLGVGPIHHAAALASSGVVLLSGGYDRVEDAEPQTGLPLNPSASVEMWEFKDASNDIVRTCAAALAGGRGRHTVSIVNRKAVFIGGRDLAGAPLATAEVATLTGGGTCFRETPTTHMMADSRTEHAVTLLEASGELLVVGGRQQEGADVFGRSIDSAEVFSPYREP